jgi:hypothetical protein
MPIDLETLPATTDDPIRIVRHTGQFAPDLKGLIADGDQIVDTPQGKVRKLGYRTQFTMWEQGENRERMLGFNPQLINIGERDLVIDRRECYMPSVGHPKFTAASPELFSAKLTTLAGDLIDQVAHGVTFHWAAWFEAMVPAYHWKWNLFVLEFGTAAFALGDPVSSGAFFRVGDFQGPAVAKFTFDPNGWFSNGWTEEVELEIESLQVTMPVGEEL